MSGMRFLAGHQTEHLAKMPFHEAVALLRDAEGIEVPGEIPTEGLPLDEIVTLENVFQHRMDEAAEIEREQHIKQLSIALKQMDPEHRALDPILVMRMEDLWVCVDGHHRLGAYREAEVTTVPARAIEGSMDDAIRVAGKENTKAKLNLTKRDRMNAAWRFTAQRIGSRREVAEDTGVSTSQVSTMRRMREEIEAMRGNPAAMDYREARSFLRGETDERDEGWEDKQVAEIERRLSKEFGKSLHKNSTLFAQALYNFSPSTVRAIVQEYASEYREEVEMMFAEEDEE